MELIRALRVGTWPLSLLFQAGVGLRNLAFDRGLFATQRVAARVVSVGNLSVGGSGKTPLVAWLCAFLRGLGLRVGVVARGYGREPGATLNDEGMLLAARFPDLSQEQDGDRVAACERLIHRGALDVILLDDGFQHRRLALDVDIVCIDAASLDRPGLLFPAGDLREPRSSLRRADMVVLTRAGALDPPALARQRDRVRALARRAIPVHAAEHEALDVIDHPSKIASPPDSLRGRSVELLSAIARPKAFEATVTHLGATVCVHHRRPDHHRHGVQEVERLARDVAARGRLLLTTEKDAVKLAAVTAPFSFLRIALRFLGDAPTAAELGVA